MTRRSRYSPEVKERAVRMVFDQQAQHESQWSAISWDCVRTSLDSYAGNVYASVNGASDAECDARECERD